MASAATPMRSVRMCRILMVSDPYVLNQTAITVGIATAMMQIDNAKNVAIV